MGRADVTGQPELRLEIQHNAMGVPDEILITDDGNGDIIQANFHPMLMLPLRRAGRHPILAQLRQRHFDNGWNGLAFLGAIWIGGKRRQPIKFRERCRLAFRHWQGRIE